MLIKQKSKKKRTSRRITFLRNILFFSLLICIGTSFPESDKNASSTVLPDTEFIEQEQEESIEQDSFEIKENNRGNSTEESQIKNINVESVQSTMFENITQQASENDSIVEDNAAEKQIPVEPEIKQEIADVVDNPANILFEIRNNNIPDFDQSDYSMESFVYYSTPDALGRCGTGYANICQDLMPTAKRDPIGMIKPSGWHTYNTKTEWNIILPDGTFYLYNRCHLLGYQLVGDHNNESNLITGTRYMNTEGMLPYENMVAQYVLLTGNHVLYRVSPIFEKNNLLASGVVMEALSIEDNGEGICFNVFIKNIQPDFSLNYATGEAAYNDGGKDLTIDDYIETQPDQKSENDLPDFIANKNTKVFHYSTCTSVFEMKEKNKLFFDGSRDDLINRGYKPCSICHP